jgi:hypothetical protein
LQLGTYCSIQEVCTAGNLLHSIYNIFLQKQNHTMKTISISNEFRLPIVKYTYNKIILLLQAYKGDGHSKSKVYNARWTIIVDSMAVSL